MRVEKKKVPNVVEYNFLKNGVLMNGIPKFSRNATIEQNKKLSYVEGRPDFTESISTGLYATVAMSLNESITAPCTEKK